jgi:hypothetical protein
MNEKYDKKLIMVHLFPNILRHKKIHHHGILGA